MGSRLDQLYVIEETCRGESSRQIRYMRRSCNVQIGRYNEVEWNIPTTFSVQHRCMSKDQAGFHEMCHYTLNPCTLIEMELSSWSLQ